jgi:hypothetical protein
MQIARWGLTVTCFEVTYIIGPVELVQPGNDDVVRCAGPGCTRLEACLAQISTSASEVTGLASRHVL